MYLTLNEVRESAVRNVAGKCPDSADFAQVVNEATQRLMRRGDFPGLVVPVQVCVLSGCVVWPRYVGQVRKINICNQPMPVRNPWYNFMQFDGAASWRGGWGANGWIGGAGFGSWWGTSAWGSWLGSACVTTGGVNTPVMQDIMGDGRYLRFYPEVQADIGKTVTVFGVDNNDQVLRHKLSDGTWEDGWVVTLASPFASTADYVRRVDRLIFEDHQGTIRAYGYNAAEDWLEDVGIYEAHDNNPVFTRYNIGTAGGGGSCCTGGNSGCTKSVIALVKLRYIPARYDTDLVLINNITALKLMIQCIKAEESNDRELARALETDAIRELNLDMTDAFPVEQTPIGNGVFGGTCVGVQRIF